MYMKISRLCVGAAALLVFFAAAAWAGIVAANFGAGADRLGCFSLRGTGLVLELCCWRCCCAQFRALRLRALRAA